jgi:hypothetical protein
MMASVTKPLSQHLADFRTQAGGIRPASRQRQVQASIARAAPIATRIETRAAAAAAAPIEQRPAIDREVTSMEQAIRSDLIVILDAVGVMVPQRTTVLAIRFTPPAAAFSRTEYLRQLQQQQSGINAMSVEHWLRNRMRYAERRAATTTPTQRGSGRNPESAAAQADLRARMRVALIRRLRSGPSSTIELPAGSGQYELDFLARAFRDAPRYGHALNAAGGFANAADAQGKVDNFMSRHHALHSPDQVVGGEADQLTGLGQGDVNSDIGANWGQFGKPRHLANDLQGLVETFLQQNGVADEFRGVVMMQVSLTL